MSHTFTHLGQSCTLYHKRPTDAHYYFSPRWGDRGQKKHHCLRDLATGRALSLEEAERAVRDLVTAHFKGPAEYDKLRLATQLRARETVGELLTAWETALCPGADRRPLSEPKRARHLEVLKLLKPWWAPRLIASITGPTLGDYAEWRRAHCRKGFAGDRAIDRDLATLSCAFAWAIATGRAQTNPFRDRPRFQDPDEVTHCTAYMPASADELHQLCGRGMSEADPITVVSCAQLLFQALTGLRPGECQFLKWTAAAAGDYPEPGSRYPVTLEGVPAELLAVQRAKGGINPAVRVRPALAQFLEAWSRYSRPKWDSAWYFPNPHNPKEPLPVEHLGKRLTRLVRDLKLPERHPHAMRAYYVRVRRSQGADDGTIAIELGQGSGAELIVNIYGDPRGIHGDGRFDWLPVAGSQVKPAWEQLTPAPATNIVQL